MIDILLNYDGQATVDSFKEYPRFMEYSSKYGYFIADAGIGFEANLKRFIAIIKVTIENTFDKIFK